MAGGDRTVIEFARPFRLRLAGGRVWHGVQFPSGHVAMNHPDEPDVAAGFTIALSVDDLLSDRHLNDPLTGACVEWPEGDDDDRR